MAGVMFAYQSDPDETGFAGFIHLKRSVVYRAETLQGPAVACQTALELFGRIGAGAT